MIGENALKRLRNKQKPETSSFNMTEGESTTDTELMSLTMNGQPEAFGVIYDRYLDTIYNYVFYRVSNEQEAEDLTEAIFLKAFEFIRGKKPKIFNVRAWLFRIAHNYVIDFYRRERHHVPLDEEFLSHKSTTEQDTLDKLRSENLKIIIQNLEPLSRDVIIHRFINGLSHKETAKVLKLRENHIRVLQYRALLKIREILEHDETS